MREAITNSVKVVAGAAIGYVVYCAVLLSEVNLFNLRGCITLTKRGSWPSHPPQGTSGAS